MNIIYRPAETSDIPSMVALLEQLFSIEEDFSFNEDLHTEGLSLLLEAKEPIILVAQHESSVIGMGTIQKRISTASGSCWGIVEDIVVDLKHRGKGIGSTLLSQLEKQAALAGLEGITLAADKNNTPALHFYHSQEWEETSLIYLRKKL